MWKRNKSLDLSGRIAKEKDDMSVQGSVKTSKGNLQTFAWIAFGIGAPQILFLQHWHWDSVWYSNDPVAALLYAVSGLLRGFIVLFALLSALKLFKKQGRLFVFLASGSWVLTVIFGQIELKLSGSSNLSEYLESLKYMMGLRSVPWPWPAWYEWANLGGTISTIIWIFIAVKLGKLKNDVAPEPVYVQNQSAFISNAPTYQPVVIQQSAPQGSFCSHCGAKSSGPVGSFCSSCGARL